MEKVLSPSGRAQPSSPARGHLLSKQGPGTCSNKLIDQKIWLAVESLSKIWGVIGAPLLHMTCPFLTIFGQNLVRGTFRFS